MKTRDKTGSRGRKTEDGKSRPETGGWRLEGRRETRRRAVCEALQAAHGGCPFACEARVTSDESPQLPRCCANCAYASLMRDGGRTLPICANTPTARGEIVRIDPDGVCPRFQASPGPIVRCKPPKPHKKGIRHIPLTKNKFAIVDECDYERLARFKWCVSSTGRKKHYACRMVGRSVVRMHREIMQAPEDMVADHIDGNGLNNCRTNLRICTHSQNLCNRQKYRGATPYKGVFYDKKRDKYYAKIKFEGRNRYLGVFDDPVEAAKAYDRKARELHGPYARLNFPDDTERPAIADAKR